jgi:hypothetical protein
MDIDALTIGYDVRNCTGCDIVIDSNAYYSTTTFKAGCDESQNDTWTSWRSGGDCNEDLNSWNYNYNLNLTTYALPDTTSLTMNRTYGGRQWTVYGAVQPLGEGECYNAPHTLVAVETTTTSVKVQDTYDYDTDSSLTRLTMIWDNDATIADPIDSAYITTSLDSPDTLEATGLSANTQYWFWFINIWGTCKDTSGYITRTTESSPVSGRICKGIKR